MPSRLRNVLALLAPLAFVASVCAPGLCATSNVTWRGGYNAPESSLEGVWMNAFGDTLEKETQGRIKFLRFPAGQMGNAESQLRQVRQGALDVTLINTDIAGSLSPRFTIFSTPYLFPSLAAADAVLSGPVGAEYLKAFDEFGLTGLAVQSHALRDILSNKPIHSAADMKGLKIRTQGSEMIDKMYQALGAIPVSIAPSEAITAMKTGTVVAEDNVSWNNYSSKVYEAAHYDIELGAIAASFVVVLNQKDFTNLSPEDQRAVRKAADAANLALQRQRNAAINNAIEGFRAAGLVISMPEQLDIASFRNAILSGVPRETDPAYQALYKSVRDYIAAHKLK